MTIKKLTILLCSLVLTCACVNDTARTKPVANSNGAAKTSPLKIITSKQDHVIELLSFIESYSSLAAEMQKKIFAETNQKLAENNSDLALRFQLATMLALPSSRLRDNTKAQSILQDLLQDNSLNPADSALLGLLYEYTSDNIKQSLKSREESKKTESIQQKYEALEQKLNELKNIEKSMSERDAKPSN